MRRQPKVAERMSAPPPRPAKYRDLGPSVGGKGNLTPPVIDIQPSTAKSAVKLTVFPTPGRRNFGWGEGVKYWAKVWDDPVARGRLKIYVYRRFPSMLEGRRQVAILSGSPDTPADLNAAPMTKQDVLHRFGSGDYAFWLNDDEAGGRHRQVCKVYLKDDSEMRQWTDYPPVLNIEDVDPDDPMNETFLRGARASQHYQSGTEGTVMDKKVEAMQRSMDRMREEKHEQELKALEARVVGEQSQQSSVVSVMAHASTTAIDMVKDQAGGGNSVEMITAVLAMVKEMQPQPQERDDSQVNILREELRGAREDAAQARLAQNTMLMESLKTMQTSVRDAKASQEPPKSFADSLQEFKAMQDVISPRRSSGAGEESPWVSVAPMAIAAAGPLFQALTAWLLSSAQRQGLPQTTAQQIAAQKPLGNAMDPTQTVLPPQQPGTAGVQPPTGNVEDPNAPPTVAQPGDVVAQQPGKVEVSPEEAARYPKEFSSGIAAADFLNSLADPLIRHFHDPESGGAEFADWYIGWQGEDHYDKLTQFQPNELLQIISQHPGIMEAIGDRKTEFARFIDDFCADPEGGEGREPQEALPPDEKELAKAGAEAIAMVAEVTPKEPRVVQKKPAPKTARKTAKAAKKVSRKRAA